VATTWFVLIAVLWTGFFVLEGFDFGVGMLVPFLGRDDAERQALRETIGPVWDGNEVWLIVAVGATFAAFPDWYATLFSAYYLPFFVVLLALIGRGVATEFRDHRPGHRWRTGWDRAMATGCLLAPFLIGLAFGGSLAGIPLDSDHEFTGGLGDLTPAYALFMGLVLAVLCLFQGLLFVRLKVDGAMDERAGRAAVRVGAVVVVLLVAYIVWTRVEGGGSGVIPGAGAWLALTFGVAALGLAGRPGLRGWAFTCSSATIAFTLVGFFGELHPNLVVSSTSAGDSVTTAVASSSYTLTLITIIAGVMLPVVLLYTAWNYWVFRRRVTGTPATDT
jgi:cytochrome d ubiquinol oxidase subunit II